MDPTGAAEVTGTGYAPAHRTFSRDNRPVRAENDPELVDLLWRPCSATTPRCARPVTSWAAIIAVPTAITGFYGQNLPYPGSGTQWGVVSSAALIAILSTVLYATFKRQDWL